MNKNNKKTVRAIVIAILFALSMTLQACNFKNDILAPMQEYKGINSECSAIC